MSKVSQYFLFIRGTDDGVKEIIQRSLREYIKSRYVMDRDSSLIKHLDHGLK